MDWFKAYQDGLLRGSLSEVDKTTQLIWMKLLAMENETRLRDGWLHYAPGRPMTREYMAMVCHVSMAELDDALAEFQGDLDKEGHTRIEIAPDGDIFIKNWEKFQAKPEKAVAKELAIGKVRQTKSSLTTAVDRLMEQVNYLNRHLRKQGKEDRYRLDNNKQIIDTETGQTYKEDEPQ